MARNGTLKNQTGHLATTRPKPPANVFNGSTRIDDARQNAIGRRLGLHNNDDMFLNDVHPFFAHYLPTGITDAEIDTCISAMLSKRRYYKAKDVAFKPLGKIIEKVMEHNPREPTQSLHFKLCPDNWVVRDADEGCYKIDACFTEVLQRKAVENRYIYLPIGLEQKRTARSRTTAHQQILGACRHMLNEDPRRLWIFGLTFENDVVSVWYFSRSHLVKTFSANWLEDPRLLVKIILSFVNADHSALGIDPLVHVGPYSEDSKAISYVYEVPREIAGGAPVFYKTGQLRSSAHPICIAGRATRVWEVTQVTAADGEIEVNPGKKTILKDVWLAAGTSTETENVDKIFEAVDAFVSTRLEAEIRDELEKNPGTARDAVTSNPQTMKRLMGQLVDNEKRFQHFDDATRERLQGHLMDKNYRAMFLTKLYDWKGLTSQGLGSSARHCPSLFPHYPDDLTDDEYMGTKAPPVHTKSTARNHHGNNSGLAQSPNTSLVKQSSLGSHDYLSQQQMRIVYDEVCDSLQEMGTLGDVVNILCQTIDALHILYAVGWVHRDISAGNILATKTDTDRTWKVKLADFEFARPMIDKNRKVASDPRTGTANFMPTEILDRHYQYEKYFKSKFGDESHLNPFGRRARQKSTLATHFNLSPTHPAYSTFKDLHPMMECFGLSPTLPPDADPTKMLPRDSVVNHNFQHDLESIWWILLWFITMNVNWLPSFDWAHTAFTHNMEQYAPRELIFHDSLDSGDSISDHLKSELVPLFPQLLEFLRSEMFTQYHKRGIFGQIELPESYSEIHGMFSEAFRMLAQMGGSWRDLEIKCGVNPSMMDGKPTVKTVADMLIVAASKHSRGEDDEPPKTQSGAQYNKKKRET